MQRILGLCLCLMVLIGLTAGVQAQERNAGIEDTIGRQLDAFNAGDVGQAWDYASPTIKRIFGTAENFGMMVRRGYPMVWNNADRRYLELRDSAGALHQKVILRDSDGRLHVLDYKMIETPEGWKIDGVALLSAADLGV